VVLGIVSTIIEISQSNNETESDINTNCVSKNPSACKRGYRGRFVMFYVITNKYNKKTKGATLMTLSPDFMTTAQDSAKIFSITHRPPSSPEYNPGTHFLLEAESTPAP